jgi:hypothetical protein
MTHRWDEFSKSLAEPVPRRESLKRLGAVLAGAVVSPLAATTVWAGGKRRTAGQDPCQSFCRCRDKKQQNQCLKVCNACNKAPGRLAGGCGSYVCCAASTISCGSYCADVSNDFYNCAACGRACPPPGPNQKGACRSGTCQYWCVEGAVLCSGTCTFLDRDPDNCGACGNVCPDSAKDCIQGVCTDMCPPGLTWCDPGCVDLLNDAYNCGACNHQCAPAEFCADGFCQGIDG